MKQRLKLLTSTLGVLVGFVLLMILGPPSIQASNAEYQRCKLGDPCTIGEFLYDDNYNPINSATCTLTSRDPAGTLFLNSVAMTANSDGWYSYTFATAGETEGMYRSQVCCTAGSDYLCLDKTFTIGDSFLSETEIGDAVWDSPDRQLTGFGSLISDIWAYSSRSLSSFGSLVSSIWSSPTRTLSSGTLDTGSLATVSDVQTETAAAVDDIKGTSDKDLSQVSTQVTNVQTTVTNIETKVDTLTTKVDSIQSDVDTILLKWGIYSISDIIGYVDQIEGSLGTNSHTCLVNDTIFGNIACIQDKWDSQTAGDIYTAANQASITATAIRAELGFNGKSTIAYDDIQTLKAYVDTVETLVGTSGDSSSTATLFGRIKLNKEAIDALDLSGVNLDALLAKWGSLDAEDIYNKVSNLSSEISAVNTVSNVSSLITLSKEHATDLEALENKVLAMKAVVDINHLLLERTSNEPIIKNWLEEGSIVFKTLILNPSSVATQTVPLKYFLPKETQKEDILKIDPNLKVDYDVEAGALYVHGEFILAPEASKTLSVEVEDVWKISDEELNALRNQTNDLFEPLKGTSYFAQGSTLKSDIMLNLDTAERLQKEAFTPDARIKAHRESMAELDSAKKKIDDLKTLVTSAGSLNTTFGFIGGVQTFSVWGIVVIFIAGFVFLAVYMKKLNGSPTPVVPAKNPESKPLEKETDIKTLPEKPKLRNPSYLKDFVQHSKLRHFTKKSPGFMIGTFIFFVLVLSALAYKSMKKENTVTPTATETSGKLRMGTPLDVTPSPEISPSPIPTTTPQIELLTKKVKVLENNVGYLNVRSEPGVQSEQVTQILVDQEVEELSRKKNEIGEEWVKVLVDEKTSGWVLSKYVVVTQDPSKITQKTLDEEKTSDVLITDPKQVLGTQKNNEVMVYIPPDANGVNVRQGPSTSSKILTPLWQTTKTTRLAEKDGWTQISIEVEKDGLLYTEGWVKSEVIQEVTE